MTILKGDETILNKKNVDLKKALEDFKVETGFDYMKLLMGDEIEKKKWKERMAKDKVRIDKYEKGLDFTKSMREKIILKTDYNEEEPAETYKIMWDSLYNEIASMIDPKVEDESNDVLFGIMLIMDRYNHEIQ